MPKLVLKSEVSENVELLTQIAEKLGFEVSVKEEKSKKKDKSHKKDKSKKVEQIVFSKKDKSSKVEIELEDDELSETAKAEDEETKPAEKLAKVKVKKVGKDKKTAKAYYEMDDDFMKGF